MTSFRQSIRSGAIQLGTFIKTASHQIPELVGAAGFDFAVIDGEHAPFDMASLDRMALAARAAALPCLMRVPDLAPAFVGQILDLGLCGVMVPHVSDAQTAELAVAASKYARGQRGFSPSTRAANYGATDASAYRERADRESSVWCQIEDREALAQIDAIAAIEDVDCLFLGRADLALSLKVDSQKDPKVVEAVKTTADAGRRHARTVGIYVGDTTEIPDLLALGISVFVCGSDQSLLLAEGRRVRKSMSDIVSARAKA